jgi:hypothetical protein
MNAKGLAILVVTLGVATQIVGCSSGQHLETITVTPTSVVFGGADPNLHVQLTATGTYIHPPATKDITNQVTWSSAVTQVAQVSNTGLVSPTTDCGVAGVSASVTTNDPTGNVITGTTTVTVDGPASDNCPTNTP